MSEYQKKAKIFPDSLTMFPQFDLKMPQNIHECIAKCPDR